MNVFKSDRLSFASRQIDAGQNDIRIGAAPGAGSRSPPAKIKPGLLICYRRSPQDIYLKAIAKARCIDHLFTLAGRLVRGNWSLPFFRKANPNVCGHRRQATYLWACPQVITYVQRRGVRYFYLVATAGNGIAGTDQHAPRANRLLCWHDAQAADSPPAVQIAVVAAQSLAAILLLGAQVFGRQVIAGLVVRSRQGASRAVRMLRWVAV